MAKLPAKWNPDQPGTVTVGTADTRVTSTGLTRTTAASDTRVTSGITATPKEATSWSAN